jgi:Tfp pilus assembly protein PilF
MKPLAATVVGLVIGLILGASAAYWSIQHTSAGLSNFYLASGHASFDRGDNVDAIAKFNRAVALDPKSWLACVALAKAYRVGRIGDLAKAQYVECMSLSDADQRHQEVESLKREMAQVE